MAELQEAALPPGWECKFDGISGKHYYVNHATRTTTWEDPRLRHRPLQGPPRHLSNGEYIPLQIQHGSPDLKRNYVYPSQTSPIRAFQMSSHQNHKSFNPLQEIRSTSRMSPLLGRTAKVQDSSLSIIQTDTDDAVSKLTAMFPTVSETHVRMLMKNCRYMKSIFPQAEETVILDVLYNNDSNIQKSSEILKEMGFQRKETVKIPPPKIETNVDVGLKNVTEEVPAPTPKVKSPEEKAEIKEKLKEKYKDVADHLISIALESVDFDAKRASQILEIMVQEDTQKEEENKQGTSEVEEQRESVAELDPKPSTLPVSHSRQSIKSLLKSEKFERNLNMVKSTSKKMLGPNPDLAQGPNDKLLLVEYVDWQGPTQSIRKGPQNLQKGPNRALLGARSYQACGSNPELRKGPKFGLAKGSVLSQLNGVVVGESRCN